MNNKTFKIALLLSVTLSSSADFSDEEFKKILLKVQENSESVEGAQYAKSADSFFQISQADSINQCFQQEKYRGIGKFEGFFMLSLKGRVKLVFLIPHSEQEKCFALAMEHFTFPLPPGPNHWIKIKIGPIALKK